LLTRFVKRTRKNSEKFQIENFNQNTSKFQALNSIDISVTSGFAKKSRERWLQDIKKVAKSLEPYIKAFLQTKNIYIKDLPRHHNIHTTDDDPHQSSKKFALIYI
jgi:hypothetical protein